MNAEYQHHGFTFVELLAATAICAILMLAVTGVIGAIGKPPAEVDITPTFNVLDLAGEQLQWDLAHARYARFNHNTLTLYGYGSLDHQTLEPAHRPVQVKYLFDSIGDQSWLVREQRNYDSVAQDTTYRQLVLTGVQQILIQVLEEPQTVFLADMDDEPQLPETQQPQEQSEVEDEMEDEQDCTEDDCQQAVEDEDNGDDNGNLAVGEDETDQQVVEVEIEWFDLKQKTDWFLVPDVVKFVFMPEQTQQVLVEYDGYDWLDEESEDEIQYPQKIVILR